MTVETGKSQEEDPVCRVLDAPGSAAAVARELLARDAKAEL
mgnify:CR=1 FL=1